MHAVAKRGARLTENLSDEVLPRLTRLEVRVFGSTPPPLRVYATTPPGELLTHEPKPSSPPLVKRATLSENAIESLQQELASFRGEVKSELAAQSRVMGLPTDDAAEVDPRGQRTAKRVRRRQWLKDAIALMTLVVAAIGGVAALAAQRSAGNAAAAVAPVPPVPVLQPQEKR